MPQITRDSLMTLEGYAKVRQKCAPKSWRTRRTAWSNWATTSR